MKTRTLLSLLALATALVMMAKAEESYLEAAGVTCTLSASGTIGIVKDKAKGAEIGIAFFSENWTPCTQFDVKQAKQKENAQGRTYGGVIIDRRSKAACPYSTQISKEKSGLKVSYKLTIPQTVELQKGSFPIITLRLPRSSYDGKTITFGNKTVKVPVNNSWGYGTRVLLYPDNATLITDGTTGMSAWDGAHSYREIRLKIEQTSTGNGVTTYEKSILIKSGIEKETKAQSEKSTKQRDPLKQKLKAYARLLAYPNYVGFESDKAFALLDQAKVAAADGKKKDAMSKLSTLEDWLDLRCRLYEITASLQQLKIYDKLLGTNYATDLQPVYHNALKALNELSTDDGRASCTKLVKLLADKEQQCIQEKGFSFLPLKQHNRLGWIKSFPIMGFTPHAEGMLNREPVPWDLALGPGLKVSLAAPARGVKIASAEATGKRAYKSVDFTGSGDKGYYCQRSWVTNEWIGGNNTITFSALTPLIMIDNTNQVTINRLTAPPESLLLPDGDDLQTVSIVPAKSFTDGEMKQNWFVVDGPYYSFGVICSKQPKQVEATSNGTEITFAEKANARLINLPVNLKESALLQEMTFWSRVAMSVPVQAVEEIRDTQASYHYAYKTMTDSWQTQPLKIAPIPPMAVLGKAPMDNTKAAAHQTRYGAYTYQLGATATFTIPAWTKPLRGINLKASAKEDAFQNMTKLNVDWVRLFMRHDWKPDEGYAILKNALEAARKNKVRMLIDPHDFIFNVKWADHLTKDEVELQKFVDLWDRLSKICKDYPDVVVGYDIYNELRIRKDWPGWKKLADRAIAVIRKNDKKTPIYMTGIDMANPSGYRGALAAEDANVVYSFHMYAPHSFTHQKVGSNNTSEAFVFYPGWIPVMDWANKTPYGKSPFTWWDRWELGACMLPVLEFAVKNNVRLHCGEFSTIGYAKPKASESARLWTKDTVDWLERYGMDWNLWNMGFGLCIPEVKEDMLKVWQSKE